MARRRAPDERSAILSQIEVNGWSMAKASTKTGIPAGTLRSWRKRQRDDSVATEPSVATEESKRSKEAPPDAKIRQVLSDLTPEQEAALWLMVGPEPMTKTAIAREVGVDRHTVGSWTRDPVFAAALSTVRTEKHTATLAALQGLAQEMVSHHGAAARLARMLVDLAIARLSDGPPDYSDTDMSTGEMVRAEADWHKVTDGMVARALEAARLLNTSPIMASGGYPKTDRVEHGGSVDVGDGALQQETPEQLRAKLHALKGGL